MTTKTSPNGQSRKQLSDQLDRLDAVLDNLSDHLNEAVAGAVQQAVGLAVERAVQGVLTELVSNPAVREMLARNADADATPSQQPRQEGVDRPSSPWDRAGQRVRAAGRACASGLKRSWKVVLAAGAGVAATAAWLGRSRLAAAAASVCGWAAGLAAAAGAALGGLLPTLAPCGC